MRTCRTNGPIRVAAGLLVIILGLLGLAPGVLAQTAPVTTLYAFTGSNGDGANPYGSLTQGRDGKFYGTTVSGGAFGWGAIFQLDSTTGTVTTLYSFTGSNGDGGFPSAGLTQGRDGTFYGTTMFGGGSSTCVEGCGTLFQFNAVTGAFTTLYRFTGGNGDGANPRAGLTQGRDGNLYGTTMYGGGASNCVNGGCGSVFQLTTATGAVTTLYGFTGSDGHGDDPFAGLTQGRDGNLYGTTLFGGALNALDCSPVGCGTVFQMDTTTHAVTTLYRFTGSNGDGANPAAGLTQGRDGNFYGTTRSGGDSSACIQGCGTLFQLNPTTGAVTTLYSFTGSNGDGVFPFARLTQGRDGNFYGTTYEGGDSSTCVEGCGTLFQLNPTTGAVTTLYRFTGSSGDGANPAAGLIQGRDGNLYGTTYQGGPFGYGTVFVLQGDPGHKP